MARTPKVEGVSDVLRILNKLEPELRKQAPKRLKAAAAPLVDEARGTVPNEPPMSGWAKGGRIGWSTAAIRRSIVIRFRSRARGNAREFVLLKLYSKSPALSVYDFAESARRKARSGRPNNPRSSEQFVRNLNTSGGKPSRVMWRAAERRLPSIQKEVGVVLRDLEDQANKAIKRAGRR